MVKGKFWTRTGFVTRDFEEAVMWISVLNNRKIIFAMTTRIYSDGEIWYVFVVNVNSIIAEDLIREEDFHDAFPVVSGGDLISA